MTSVRNSSAVNVNCPWLSINHQYGGAEGIVTSVLWFASSFHLWIPLLSMIINNGTNAITDIIEKA